jgi:VWFA-related protein
MLTRLAACLWVAVALQQQPIFRSTVELVHVDVVVVDKDGNAVRGLTEKDFVLKDRKKPQVIATFEEVSHERLEGTAAVPVFPPTLRLDVASNQTVQADRLVVMVIDDLHIYNGRTDKSKELARRVITELGAQASMAVIFTSGERSTQVTEDRSVLLTAANTLKGRKGWRKPHEANDKQRSPNPFSAGGSMDSRADDALLSRLDAISDTQKISLQEFQDNMAQFKALQEAARILGADDARRKAFVLLSEGIAKDMTGVFEHEITPCEAVIATLDPPPCYHDRSLREMMESMRRSSVSTYALDPRGKVTSQQLALEMFPDLTTPKQSQAPRDTSVQEELPKDLTFRWNNPIRQAQDGLSVLAEASGGFAITDSDDYDTGIKRIIEDIDHYYLLGFYPADPMGKFYRPIQVEVAGHPDWKLRYRWGYMPGGAPKEPENKNPLVALSAGVMPKTDLPLRLVATALPSSSGKNSVIAAALEITAPTRELLEADGKLRDEVGYAVLVVDNKKSKVASRDGKGARVVLSARDGARRMPETVTYQVPLSIDLTPGEYQIRASATSQKLGKGGSVYLSITVPDFSKEPIVLSGLAIGYADGSRVPVGRVPAAAGLPRPIPFEPSLSREFTARDAMRVFFEIARKDMSSSLAIAVALVDLDDNVVSSSVNRIAEGAPGRVDLRMPLRGLAAGPYILRVSVTDGKNTVQNETGIIVK